MPQVGLGTYLAKNGDETYYAVLEALKVGYRHIDTATMYGNEASVGRAIADSGIPRKEIFITTKLNNPDQGYFQTKQAFEKSLQELGVDYIDLYLIHWPRTYQLTRESWKAMEELYFAGKVRAIGVSNFQIHHLEDLMQVAYVIPQANQVELHPGLQQVALQRYCEGMGIKLISHSPLMRGQAFQIPLLQDLAKKYNKSVANIVVRWGLQRGIFMIPKSVTKQRIHDNFQVFDFSLSYEDMELIKTLNNGKRLGSDPDNKNF